ncbi:protein of unknown function [Methylacidimicrobium sp. AP8]|nr:protein of unknown function [Methylacidimicrobium sp. AP8]
MGAWTAYGEAEGWRVRKVPEVIIRAMAKRIRWLDATRLLDRRSGKSLVRKSADGDGGAGPRTVSGALRG